MFNPDTPPQRWSRAKVIGLSPLTIVEEGSDQPIPGIASLSYYTPTIGDIVEVRRTGTDLLVLGPVTVPAQQSSLLEWAYVPDFVDAAAGAFQIQVARVGLTALPARAQLRVSATSTATPGTNYVHIGAVELAWDAEDNTDRTVTITPIAAEAGDVTLVLELAAPFGVLLPDPISIVLRDLETTPQVLAVAYAGSADLGDANRLDGQTIAGCTHIYITDPPLVPSPILPGVVADRIDWFYGDGPLPDTATLDGLNAGSPEWVRTEEFFQGQVDGVPRAWCTNIAAPYNDRWTGGVVITPQPDGEIPDPAGGIYPHWSSSQIATCKARMGTSPWSSYKSGHDSAVSAGMASGLVSVTDNGGTDTNPRQWATDPAYLPGGEIYAPGAERYDYIDVGLHLSKVTNALAMEWHLTGDTAAAQKAVDLLWHHLGNPSKSLDPTVKAAGTLARNVEIYNSHTGIFRAVGHLWGYGGWEAQQRQQILDWLDQYCITHRPFDQAGTITDENNIDIWRAASRSTAAAVLGDTSRIVEEATWFIDRIARLQRSDGLWAAEQARDRGVFYTMYACMTSCLFGLTVNSQTSEDLLGWASGGRGIKAGLDAMVPFVNVSNPRVAWEETGRSEIEQNGAMDKTTMQVDAYEVGYSVWGDSVYVDIINRWGRPLGNAYSSYNWTFYAGAEI